MQNWNQWQLPSATARVAGGGSMPQPPAGPGYPAPGADPMATMQAYMQYYNQPAPSGYTAEQWAAAQQQNWTQWQQWQQQYQQWQAQYGAKYQESLKQFSSGVSGVPPVPSMQPPPLPKEDATTKQPPLPPDNASSYQSSLQPPLPPPHQNNMPLFPSKNNGNPSLTTGQHSSQQFDNNSPNDNLPSGNKRTATTDCLSDSAKKLKIEEQELTEAEKTFDAQFKQWEEQFNKWKQQNANHPDKAQYKQYEAKWTAWREKLIERREQMRKKREAQRAKIEAEKKKNMPGDDKIMNILSSTENQGLINNLLGIGKTLGLTGNNESQSIQPPLPPTSTGTTSQENQQMYPNSSDISQPWANTQPWSTQYNMPNMSMSGFSNFNQPPPLMSLNQPPTASNMPEFNQSTQGNSNNYSLPPPAFQGMNPQMDQNNFGNQGGPGRRDDNQSLNRDAFGPNQDRFNDQRSPNDQFRGNGPFDRDNSRGMGQNDNFSNDRFSQDGNHNDFRSDSFAPSDRFNDRPSNNDRFVNDRREQDKYGSGSFNSNFDRNSQDRFSSEDRFNSGNNRPGDNRFNDRFGNDRFGASSNRYDSSDSNDRRDSFGPNSRNQNKNDRFNPPADMPPELKALMEKRRAAQDVFKPSSSFFSSDKSSTTFGSLGESFRKITGDLPYLPRDRPGDRGRMSPNSSSRPFGGGPNAGPDNKFRGNLPPRGPGPADSRDSGFRRDDSDFRGGNFGPRGPSDSNTTQQKPVSLLDLPPPWMDPNMMSGPMGIDDKDSRKPPEIPTLNRESLGNKDVSFNNPNACSSPAPEPLIKKSDVLPFMGENDPKPEDLNMEPPPELPDLGPVKQGPNQGPLGPPFDRKPGGHQLDRPGDFFNGPNCGPFNDRGDPFRGPNEPPFGMRGMGDSHFGPRGEDSRNDGPFGPRQNAGPFGPGGDVDDRMRKGPGDNGPRPLMSSFGSRDNNDFGPRNQRFGPGDFGPRGLEPPFGQRDDLGPRGGNQPFGPRDDTFGPRGPNAPMGPRDNDDFGTRGPNGPFGQRDDDNFGPRGPLNPFGLRDNDNFGSRGDMDTRQRNLDDFGPRGPKTQFDIRDRPFGPDNFSGRSNDGFGPRGGSNLGDNPNRGSLMDGPMNQPRDMMMDNANRPFSRFGDDMNKPFDQKSMNDLRPPMPDLRKDMDRQLDRDDMMRMSRGDRPFVRPDDIGASGRPFGPRGFDDRPNSMGDRDNFSRRLDEPGPQGDLMPEFCAKKQFNYNHGGRPANEIFPDFVPLKVIDYGHVRRPLADEYVTPSECFDYGHGKFMPRAPQHEIFPRMDFRHWVDNEQNIKEYDEGLKVYESRKRYERMMKSKMEERRRREEQRYERDREPYIRDYPSDRFAPRDRADRGRSMDSYERKDHHRKDYDRKEYDRKNYDRKNYDRKESLEFDRKEFERMENDSKEFESYDEYLDSRDQDSSNVDRSKEKDTEKHRDDRSRRSISRERQRDKYDRTRMDTDSELIRDDERFKKNISNQEIRSKTPFSVSSSKDISHSASKNVSAPPKTLELGRTPDYTMVDDLLSPPGRYDRPLKIVIILRGPPGGGKSYIAKLIKDKEMEHGGCAPRILSLDDYFLVEKEVETKDDNGKKIITKEMVYEYEEAMEPSYVASLVKAFKKNITDGFFNFIILDAINEKISDYEELWSFAKTKGFKVFVCEMEMDVTICLKRNIHNRTEDEVNRIIDYFEPTPSYHQKLDVSSLLQESAIEEVQMEEVESFTGSKQGEGNDDSQDSQEDRIDSVGVSKWEKMEAEDKLDRLDGLKRKGDGRPQTMEDFLQVPDYYNMEDNSGKKRVRWADLEERKEQEKMRAMGFVVGQTNWDRMMDPTKGSSALTRTKYI